DGHDRRLAPDPALRRRARPRLAAPGRAPLLLRRRALALDVDSSGRPGLVHRRAQASVRARDVARLPLAVAGLHLVGPLVLLAVLGGRPAHGRGRDADRRLVRHARRRRLAVAAGARRERSAPARTGGPLTSHGMETPSWGIEPVPERLRVLGAIDSLLLWINLGISLLVLVAAAYFGLSLKQAVLATIVGGVIGNTMLGVAAYIGADARVPTMVLQRAPLGQRGSYLATALNVLQCLGWSVFEITVIAIAAGALSERLFHVHLVWMWKLVFGAVGLMLALLGPVGFVRRFVRKIGIWAVGASIVYLAVWIIRNGHVGTLWHQGGHGGSFWLGV